MVAMVQLALLPQESQVNKADDDARVKRCRDGLTCLSSMSWHLRGVYRSIVTVYPYAIWAWLDRDVQPGGCLGVNDSSKI